MNILEVRQAFKKEYDIVRTDVYIDDYEGQREDELIEWCIENFGDYRLSHSKPELKEPQNCTLFIFKNLEQAMAFKLRWA